MLKGCEARVGSESQSNLLMGRDGTPLPSVEFFPSSDYLLKLILPSKERLTSDRGPA